MTLRTLHPMYGVEIVGVDVAKPLDDATFGEIRAALDEHSLLLFRGLDMTDERQIAFSERFGPLLRATSNNLTGGTPFSRQSNLDVKTGEFIPAGQPVVSLLPPDNLKVRFFVPEEKFSTLKAGQSVRVALSGRPSPLNAHISYLSPAPEYTPPVLYNRENRAKLVFLVEALFPADDARDLHPGQPVEVSLAP